MNSDRQSRPEPVNSTRNKILRGLFLVLLVAMIVGCCLLLRRTYEITGGAATLHRLGLRVAMVVLALIAWFRSQSLIASRSVRDGVIADRLHELSRPIHGYLLRHPKIADRVLILSSAGIDAFGVFLIAASVFGPTMRPFVGLLIVFICRQLCQGLCALPIPRDMIWRDPGFPSLLVTYGVANDFFFSGHTAIATLGAIEVARLAPGWLGLLAASIAILEAVTVVVLRAHYTMDIIAALFAAWVAADVAGRLCVGL